MAETILTSSGLQQPGVGRQTLILRACAALVILGCWEAVARSGLFYEGVVPRLYDIFRAFSIVVSPDFRTHFAATMLELASSVVIGGVMGIFAGVILGGRSIVADAFHPVIYYLAPTPKIVFLPIFFALFGVYLGPKIAVGSLSAFFPIAMSVASGRRQVNITYIKVMESYGASRQEVLIKAIMPALVLPAITGLRLGVGLAIVGVLLAETKISNVGIGFLAMQSYERFLIPRLYAVLLLTFLFSALINAGLYALEARYVRN